MRKKTRQVQNHTRSDDSEMAHEKREKHGASYVLHCVFGHLIC